MKIFYFSFGFVLIFVFIFITNISSRCIPSHKESKSRVTLIQPIEPTIKIGVSTTKAGSEIPTFKKDFHQQNYPNTVNPLTIMDCFKGFDFYNTNLPVIFIRTD